MTNLKVRTTKLMMEQAGIIDDERSLNDCMKLWWRDPRQKATGGLRLTPDGYKSLIDAGVKEYKISMVAPVRETSQLIINMSRYIDCPFYLAKKSVSVFSERMAIQIIMFSGDVALFIAARDESNHSIK